ncbi:MAG: CBS domain-containing protein [Thermoproteus sp.]|jgi:CBS domain-containing protein|uniref:CBS domain-containing protein n=1 Tax=Thermoproteus sp. CP80 TaxID=1650659 RepID=UPI0007488603|nr:CBS domain-containing protein [Thermoproteus sp. CP80]KUO87593.1 MAG: histidine kinase [Thermoproteus sp. JCHS_4]MCI4464636.1 CBS domain-containing protein [Thermoproteus sp.]MDT7868551.1 CBS domain-containing protein [Thermoproteus sp.]MDT7882798.1 CBS domain-containing protein [Thermoproteus sp.]PLC65020.1 histidine kinase [Thermoproteus sp. CP80]
MEVKNVMSDRVVYCTTRDTIRCAVSKMYAYNIGSVLVVDDVGNPVGIFTERDLVKAVAEGISLDTPLEKLAPKELIKAYPNESVFMAAQKMIEHNIRHIPVVEGNRVVGILSIRDALRSLMALEGAYP